MNSPHESLPELQWRDPPAPGAEVSAAIRKTCTQDLNKGRGLAAVSYTHLTLPTSDLV